MDSLTDHERQQLVERMRRTGLRMDREGRWWHEGQQVKHSGLARAINRWLDRLPDGRYVLRLDENRYAYVDIEDAPFIVRTLSFDAEQRVHLQLSDETSEELAYDTLRVARQDNVLYCTVRQGRFDARFCRQAYYMLAEHFVETESGHVSLSAAGRQWSIFTA